MAEVAGLVMSAAATAALLIQVVKIGDLYVREIRNWHNEAEQLAIRMADQMERTDAIRKIFFGEACEHSGRLTLSAGGPGVLVPLFDHLNYQTKSTVYAMMQQFHNIINLRYRSLQTVYSLSPPGQAEQTKKFRLSWVMWGRRRVKSVADECEEWNDRLFGVIQVHVIGQLSTLVRVHPDRSLSENVSGFKSDKNIMRLKELENEIDLAQLSMSENQKWESHEILGRIVFDEDDSFEGYRCGHLNGRRVVVDFKSFEPAPQDHHATALSEPPPKILNRIRQLAALLHRQHSARARLLPCEGFYRDARRPMFGFVFDVPAYRFHKPNSLHYLLEQSRAPKLALDSRVRLALAVASAIFQFHTVGWVHKSLRSSNILFFPEKAGDISSIHYDELWLVGFEYSREDPGFSENPRKLDMSNDIYRHPEHWGEPTRRFERSHDVYSLGMILLEIGLWKPAYLLERNGFRETDYTERFDVQNLFIQSAKDKLPFMVGTAYTEVVVKCLTGNFDLSETNDGLVTQQVYQEQLIEELRRIGSNC